MTATGLKAAPHSRKIGTAIWRLCAGHPVSPAPQTPPVESTNSPSRSPEPRPTAVARGAPSLGLPAHGSPTATRAGQKLLIFTDAWAPQVNGVVRTLETLGEDLRSRGWIVRYATPLDHSTLPLPTYPEIRLALFPRRRLARMLDEFAPDAIHIAAEGTIGM